MQAPPPYMDSYTQWKWTGRAVAAALLSVVAVLGGMLTGCKKTERGAAAIAALLPEGMAARVPVELQLLAEELPEDTQGFGFVDGASLGALAQLTSSPRLRPMVKDLAEMAKRRWGFELGEVRAAGIIFYQGDDLLALVVPSKHPQPGSAGDEIGAASLGPLVILGAPRTVEAFVAAAKQKPRLSKQRPAWISGALVHAAQEPVFFTADAPLVRSWLPAIFAPQLESLEQATFTAGATGVSVFLAGKPGRGDQLEADAKAVLGLVRARWAASKQELEAQPGRRLLAVLLHHYGEAAFKSLEQKRTGDELALTLGWHAPAWPKWQPAPLADRLSVVDELAVSQLNLGMPALQLFLQLTDVLAAPLDRAALHRELVAALDELEVPRGLEPSAFTISAGASGAFTSVKNASLGDAAAPPRLPFPDLAAVATGWGLAVAEGKDRDALLLASVSENPAASGLAQAKLLADDTAFARMFFDVTKMPPEVRVVAVLAPLRSIAVALTETSFVLEARTDPGKAKELAEAMRRAMEVGMATVASLPHLRKERSYAERARAPVSLEAMLIFQHHLMAMMPGLLAPEVVAGDRLRIERRFSPAQGRALFVALATGMVGGVVVPAFQRKLRDAPYDSLSDPDGGGGL